MSEADAPKDYQDSRATIDDRTPSPSSEANRRVEVAQQDAVDRARNDALIREGESARDFVEDPMEALEREGKKKLDG